MQQLNTIKWFLLFLLALIFTACEGGGSSSSGVTTKTSKLIDASVTGVSYECTGFSGFTDDGDFDYSSTCGNITFKVGGVKLNSIDASTLNSDAKLYISELAGEARTNISSVVLINILRFLQSIDDDANPSNGIVITQAVRDALASSTLDLSDPLVTEAQLTTLLNSIGKTLVSERDAVAHFRQTLVADDVIRNTAPTATAQSVTFNEDTTANVITLTGADGDGNGLTYSIVTSPLHGTFTQNAGSITYTPTENYYGTDSFTFTVNDGTVDSAPVLVDILINNVNDAPTLQKNSFTVSFVEHNITTNIPEPVKAESVDLDGDGDIDIISGTSENSDRKFVWYENDGNQNFIEHNITNTPEDLWSIHAVDLDKDSDMDILVSILIGGEDSSIRWFENDGSQNFTEHNLSKKHTDLIVLGLDYKDIDNDGDIDIVGIADIENSNEEEDASIILYVNDGSQNFTEHNISFVKNKIRFGVKFVDLDLDGDFDIISSPFVKESIEENNIFSWYENDGNQNFIEHNISTQWGEGSLTSYNTNAIDMDGDNDIDLLINYIYKDDIYRTLTVWYENDGNQNFLEHNISQGYYNNFNVESKAIDIDNDGDIDVLSPNIWFENNGTEHFIEHRLNNIELTIFITFSDIDNDGDIDMASPYHSNDTLAWHENRGVNSWYVKENNLTVESIMATDIEGDNLIYGVVGEDSALFDVNTTTGLVSFKVMPDYENPLDANADNIYEIKISVSDGVDSDNFDVLVIVEDITDE